MYNKDVSNLSQLPVQQGKRWSTDICCTVISTIFALTLFVLACVFFSSASYEESLNVAYFSSSTVANQCAPKVTFIGGPPQKISLHCVQACPVLEYYNSNGVCWRKDQVQAAKYAENPYLSPLLDYSGFKWALLWTALLAFSIGLIWFLLSLWLPRQAPGMAVVLAVLCLLVMGILIATQQSGYLALNKAVRIIALIVLFGLAIIISVMGILYRNSLRLQGLFLDYSKTFISINPHVLAYIPLFIISNLALLCLFIFQHAAFSSKHNSNSNFFDFSNPGILGWLNLIQLIWGIQFLRDSSNYCISANVVDWYWTRNTGSWYAPFKRLLLKNWGSLVAGSFINAFFELPTLVVQLFICHKNTCCNRVGDYCDNNCSCLDYVFNLVRTDTYTYINLAGIPYCNSARQCAKICHFISSFVGKYNPLKHYRFIVLVLIVSVSSLLGYIFTNIRVVTITFWHIFCLVLVAYQAGIWVVSMGIDAAESLSTNFFVEYYESHEFEYMSKALPVFRKEVEHYNNKEPKDGNC